MKGNISDQRHSMSFCFSQLPLCLSIEFYTFYLSGLAYFFSSLLLDILLFYCDCSFAFFSPSTVSILWVRISQSGTRNPVRYFSSRGYHMGISCRLTGSVEEQERRDFYLEIRELLTPGAQSLPCLPCWRSYHCPCWTPSEGSRTGVPGVLSCLSHPPATPASCECLTLTETVRNEATKGGWKMSSSPQSSQQSREGECGAKR